MESSEKTGDQSQKLIVKIIALSDFRQIHPSVTYTPVDDETVEYIGGRYDEKKSDVILEKVVVKPGAWLGGAKSRQSGKDENDTLSKLRAYFGYQEVVKLLMKDSLFASYIQKGEVLFPDKMKSEAEFRKQMEKSKIILLMEGQQFDTNVIPEEKSYAGGRKENNYYRLDNVRRVGLEVNQLKYQSGRFIPSECCKETTRR